MWYVVGVGFGKEPDTFYLRRSRQVYILSEKSGRGTSSNQKSWYIAELMSWAIPQL